MCYCYVCSHKEKRGIRSLSCWSFSCFQAPVHRSVTWTYSGGLYQKLYPPNCSIQLRLSSVISISSLNIMRARASRISAYASLVVVQFRSMCVNRSSVLTIDQYMLASQCETVAKGLERQKQTALLQENAQDGTQRVSGKKCRCGREPSANRPRWSKLSVN